MHVGGFWNNLDPTPFNLYCKFVREMKCRPGATGPIGATPVTKHFIKKLKLFKGNNYFFAK